MNPRIDIENENRIAELRMSMGAEQTKAEERMYVLYVWVGMVLLRNLEVGVGVGESCGLHLNGFVPGFDDAVVRSLLRRELA